MNSRFRLVGLFVLYFCFILTGALVQVPLVRLVEQAICNQHFRRASPSPPGRVHESECKTPDIQNVLSNVIGWKLSFDAVPGLLTSVYYGSLASRFGRLTVLWFSALGYLLALSWVVIVCSFDDIFPVRLAWMSSLFMFIGGGRQVFFAMIFTLVSDQAEHEHRSKQLYIFSAGAHACSIVGPLTAAGLMSLGTYVPFWVIFGLLGFVLMGSPFLSEHDDEATHDGAYQAVPANGEGTTPACTNEQAHENVVGLATDDDLLDPAAFDDETPLISRPGLAAPKLRRTMPALWSLLCGPATRFVLAAFFVKRIAIASEQFMFQYASEKFHWPLRETAILRFAVGSGAVFATTVIGPLITHYLVKLGVPSQKVDLNVVRAALLVLGTAFTGAWQANSAAMLTIAMAFAGIGEILEPSLQGFATFVTNSTHNALLFTSVATCHSLANLIGGPVNSYLMTLGRRPGHQDTGIVFLGAMIMFYALFVWACLLPSTVTQPAAADDEGCAQDESV